MMNDSSDEAVNYDNQTEDFGGAIPMDNTTRATVEKIEERYGSVNVRYDEGVAHVTGPEEEVYGFVHELNSAEAVHDSPDHPNDSIMDEAEIGSGWNVLDSKQGKTV